MSAMDIETPSHNGFQDPRLMKDYATRRESQELSTLAAMSLDDDPFRNLHRSDTPFSFGSDDSVGQSLSTEMLDNALSTAEYLLGLPMDGDPLPKSQSMVSFGSKTNSPK